MKKWLIVCLILVAGVTPLLAHANGVVRTGNCIGAEQCGAGISGIATATDASVPYANPAGLAEQRGGWSVQVGFDAIYPQYRFTAFTGHETTSERHLLVLPLLMVSTDVTRNLRLGSFSHVPYGLRTDFPTVPEATKDALVPSSLLEQRGKITLRGDGFAVGLRLLDGDLLLGGSVFHADTDIDSVSSIRLPTKLPSGEFLTTRQIIKTDGDGWGGTVGIRWRPTERLTLGAVYRSPVRVETKGTFREERTLPQALTVRTDFTFPESWGIGAAWWVIPRQLRVTGEFTHFKQARADDLFIRFETGGISHVKLDWRDTQAYQLGFEWFLRPDLTLRAGGGWVGAAIPKETVSPTFLDAPGWDVSIGFSKMWGQVKVDISAMEVWAPTRTVKPGEGATPGQYGARIHQIALLFSYKF